jgi:hypothetical protein
LPCAIFSRIASGFFWSRIWAFAISISFATISAGTSSRRTYEGQQSGAA